MTPLETTILQTLNELDEKVRAMPGAGPKPNLVPLFTRLDELASQLPGDPTLRHYLQRKSYEKARLHLLGRDQENQRGRCGH